MSSTLVQLKPARDRFSGSGAELKIGELAKATGKTQRALRLYEELGLLTPGTRTAGNFRLYSGDAIERVHWINKLQDLGFTLQQIHTLVSATAQGEHAPRDVMEQVRALYADKQAEVRAQMEKLAQLQREITASLTYLETCVAACTQESAHGTSCCGTCETHGDERAPSLVEGIRS